MFGNGLTDLFLGKVYILHMGLCIYGDDGMAKKVHVLLEDDVYKGLWQIVKAKYTSPVRKFHIVLNEILRKGIKEEKQKLGLE